MYDFVNGFNFKVKKIGKDCFKCPCNRNGYATFQTFPFETSIKSCRILAVCTFLILVLPKKGRKKL